MALPSALLKRSSLGDGAASAVPRTGASQASAPTSPVTGVKPIAPLGQAPAAAPAQAPPPQQPGAFKSSPLLSAVGDGRTDPPFLSTALTQRTMVPQQPLPPGLAPKPVAGPPPGAPVPPQMGPKLANLLGHDVAALPVALRPEPTAAPVGAADTRRGETVFGGRDRGHGQQVPPLRGTGQASFERPATASPVAGQPATDPAVVGGSPVAGQGPGVTSLLPPSDQPSPPQNDDTLSLAKQSVQNFIPSRPRLTGGAQFGMSQPYQAPTPFNVTKKPAGPQGPQEPPDERQMMVDYQRGRRRLLAQAHAQGLSPEELEKQLTEYDGKHQQAMVRFQKLQEVASGRAQPKPTAPDPAASRFGQMYQDYQGYAAYTAQVDQQLAAFDEKLRTLPPTDPQRAGIEAQKAQVMKAKEEAVGRQQQGAAAMQAEAAKDPRFAQLMDLTRRHDALKAENDQLTRPGAAPNYERQRQLQGEMAKLYEEANTFHKQVVPPSTAGGATPSSSGFSGGSGGGGAPVADTPAPPAPAAVPPAAPQPVAGQQPAAAPAEAKPPEKSIEEWTQHFLQYPDGKVPPPPVWSTGEASWPDTPLTALAASTIGGPPAGQQPVLPPAAPYNAQAEYDTGRAATLANDPAARAATDKWDAMTAANKPKFQPVGTTTPAPPPVPSPAANSPAPPPATPSPQPVNSIGGPANTAWMTAESPTNFAQSGGSIKQRDGSTGYNPPTAPGPKPPAPSSTPIMSTPVVAPTVPPPPPAVKPPRLPGGLGDAAKRPAMGPKLGAAVRPVSIANLLGYGALGAAGTAGTVRAMGGSREQTIDAALAGAGGGAYGRLLGGVVRKPTAVVAKPVARLPAPKAVAKPKGTTFTPPKAEAPTLSDEPAVELSRTALPAASVTSGPTGSGPSPVVSSAPAHFRVVHGTKVPASPLPTSRVGGQPEGFGAGSVTTPLPADVAKAVLSRPLQPEGVPQAVVDSANAGMKRYRGRAEAALDAANAQTAATAGQANFRLGDANAQLGEMAGTANKAQEAHARMKSLLAQATGGTVGTAAGLVALKQNDGKGGPPAPAPLPAKLKPPAPSPKEVTAAVLKTALDGYGPFGGPSPFGAPSGPAGYGGAAYGGYPYSGFGGQQQQPSPQDQLQKKLVELETRWHETGDPLAKAQADGIRQRMSGQTGVGAGFGAGQPGQPGQPGQLPAEIVRYRALQRQKANLEAEYKKKLEETKAKHLAATQAGVTDPDELKDKAELDQLELQHQAAKAKLTQVETEAAGPLARWKGRSDGGKTLSEIGWYFGGGSDVAAKDKAVDDVTQARAIYASQFGENGTGGSLGVQRALLQQRLAAAKQKRLAAAGDPAAVEAEMKAKLEAQEKAIADYRGVHGLDEYDTHQQELRDASTAASKDPYDEAARQEAAAARQKLQQYQQSYRSPRAAVPAPTGVAAGSHPLPPAPGAPAGPKPSAPVSPPPGPLAAPGVGITGKMVPSGTGLGGVTGFGGSSGGIPNAPVPGEHRGAAKIAAAVLFGKRAIGAVNGAAAGALGGGLSGLLFGGDDRLSAMLSRAALGGGLGAGAGKGIEVGKGRLDARRAAKTPKALPQASEHPGKPPRRDAPNNREGETDLGLPNQFDPGQRPLKAQPAATPRGGRPPAEFRRPATFVRGKTQTGDRRTAVDADDAMPDSIVASSPRPAEVVARPATTYAGAPPTLLPDDLVGRGIGRPVGSPFKYRPKGDPSDVRKGPGDSWVPPAETVVTEPTLKLGTAGKRASSVIPSAIALAALNRPQRSMPSPMAPLSVPDRDDTSPSALAAAEAVMAQLNADRPRKPRKKKPDDGTLEGKGPLSRA